MKDIHIIRVPLEVVERNSLEIFYLHNFSFRYLVDGYCIMRFEGNPVHRDTWLRMLNGTILEAFNFEGLI